jgi:hypothetical protein
MSSSGTYNFDLDLADVIEEAFELCGLEARNGYDFRTARRSMDLMLLEWQNKGLNLWTVKDDTQALTAGTLSYPLSAEKLDVIEASVRTNDGSSTSQTDIYMTPISISNYARQTNKLTQGRPIQYWIEKAPTGITLNVWPVPDATESYVIHYYYLNRVQDTGKPGSNTAAIPPRFLPVLTAGLAYYISMKKAIDRTALLKSVYDEQWNLAADSDRNKASFFVKPGGYA